MIPDEYLEWIIPSAKRVCEKYSLPWQVVVAQGAIESQWGKYGLGNGNYNIFGRKWGGWGEYVEVETEECYDGVWQTITDKFQSYDNMEDAIADWCVLMTEEPVYAPALEVWNITGDMWEFLQIMGSVYATDPEYSSKVWRTIRACDLV